MEKEEKYRIFEINNYTIRDLEDMIKKKFPFLEIRRISNVLNTALGDNIDTDKKVSRYLPNVNFPLKLHTLELDFEYNLKDVRASDLQLITDALNEFIAKAFSVKAKISPKNVVVRNYVKNMYKDNSGKIIVYKELSVFISTVIDEGMLNWEEIFEEKGEK